MLEPIFLYRASKCKNPKNRAAKTVYGPKLLPLYVIIIVFFSCQDANLQRKTNGTISNIEWRVKLHRCEIISK